MPIGPGDATDPGDALREALAAAVAVPDIEATDPLPASIDVPSLVLGLRIGTERPGEAERLLALIARDAGPEVAGESVVAPAVDGDAVSSDAESAPEVAAVSTDVPAVSSLLARSAALPLEALADLGPDVVFGWAEGLAPATVLAIGGVVQDMLAGGAPKDVARGFGLAWDAGARLPHRDLDPLLRAFTSLEIVVAGVLAGRDLRVGNEPPPRPGGLGGLLGAWMPRREAGETQAAAVLDRFGEDGRRGLVALWNAWVAMRYRPKVAEPTFELLVRPWVTVVGPLPPAT